MGARLTLWLWAKQANDADHPVMQFLEDMGAAFDILVLSSSREQGVDRIKTLDYYCRSASVLV